MIATEGTVRGGAYQQAILRQRPDAEVEAAACQLFVALAEEGWNTGAVAAAAVQAYLAPLFDRRGDPGTGSGAPTLRPDVPGAGLHAFPGAA